MQKNKHTKKGQSQKKDIKKPSKRVKTSLKKIKNAISDFKKRRPHRSFRLTKRRDYKRSLKMPGYFAFTLEVFLYLWKYKKLFLGLAAIVAILTFIFGLAGSQAIYSQVSNLMKSTAPDELFSGPLGSISQAGILLFYAATNGLNTQLDPGQVIISIFMSLYLWLTVVWMMRKISFGKKFNLRDALYRAGSPIISTFLVFFVIAIQLIPAALATIVFVSALQTSFLSNGIELMLGSISYGLVIILTLFWIVPSFFAIIVVALPGVYPSRALMIAGDLVTGRRLRLIYRIIWMFLVALSFWVVIMIPVILFDDWIKSIFKNIAWIPIVPLALLFMSIFSVIWSSTYLYLLYRKVVSDGSAPA